ncbi:hypothetical protein PIB30_075075, partial [Stylosanthes scabra]|nr:hypothetical protein [Stylosanthes scabra]
MHKHHLPGYKIEINNQRHPHPEKRTPPLFHLNRGYAKITLDMAVAMEETGRSNTADGSSTTMTMINETYVLAVPRFFDSSIGKLRKKCAELSYGSILLFPTHFH